MKNNFFKQSLVHLLIIGLTSCAIGPNYKSPPVDVPDHWQSAAKSSPAYSLSKEPNAVWWLTFHDPVLNQLMDKAIANNLDLKIATNRVLAAKANRLYALAQLFPEARINAQDSRQNQGWLTANRRLDIVEGTVNASWEFDIFGANRRKLEAQNDFLSANIEARNDVLVSLLAEVATSYIDYRMSQRQIAITNKNIHAAFASRGLSKSLQKAGIVSELDVFQANSLYLTFKAQVSQQNVSLTTAKNRLTALLGLYPGELDHMLGVGRIPQVNEKILLLTPAEAIRQRPDIRRAERELAAQTALIGSAMAEWLPKISIGGLYGRQGTNFYPSLDIWSFVPRLQLPLLEFGRIKSQVDLAKAKQREAFYNYQQIVLNALEEVEDQLTAYVDLTQREHLLKLSAQSNNSALSLAQERYKKGLSAFINVVQSEQDYYLNENAAIIAAGDKAKRAVALYKSMGIHSVEVC